MTFPVGGSSDVVVFDPATAADTATHQNPFSGPVGITAVLVTGAVKVREGQRGAPVYLTPECARRHASPGMPSAVDTRPARPAGGCAPG